MTEVHALRKLYYDEGKSMTEISRDTGRDRKTIRVNINKEDWNETPVKPVPEVTFPKLDPFKAKIDAWLTEDKKAKRKQRHTGRRVYERLKEEVKADFNCSYRTVVGYVSQRKKEIFSQKAGRLPRLKLIRLL